MNSNLDDGGDRLRQDNQSDPSNPPIVDNLIDVEIPETINEATTPASVPSPAPTAINYSHSTQSNIDPKIASSTSHLEVHLAPLQLSCQPSEGDDEDKILTSTEHAVGPCEAGKLDSYQAATKCNNCSGYLEQLDRLKAEKLELEDRLNSLRKDLDHSRNELDREVKKRVDLEQQFTEEAKRTTDQIEEFMAKSDRDDSKLTELRNKFEMYSREMSSMIEHFTTNRELLSSQLLDLRNENDYLLGRYLSKAVELQRAEIDLPQNVEELQFHCLTLNEKLILATMAKERLEETLIKSSAASGLSIPSNTTMPA